MMIMYTSNNKIGIVYSKLSYSILTNSYFYILTTNKLNSN